jgi:hypothetical protein
MRLRSLINIYRRYRYWKKAGCIFIHVPKVAGTSISNALYGRTLGHYSISEVMSRFPRLAECGVTFSVVRNPYDRLVSAYTFAKLGKTSDMGVYLPEQYNVPEFSSFERFVLEWISVRDLSELDHIFRLQKNYLYVGDFLAVDHVFKLETLDEDLPRLYEIIGHEIAVKNMNSSGVRKSYKEYYSLRVSEVVFQKYRADFDAFGYEKESWR